MLIVDDIAAAARVSTMKLELFGFDTVPTGSVDEALEQLAKDPVINVVLADELMPVSGGLDLLAHCAAITLRHRCPSFCCPCSAPIMTPSSTNTGRMPWD